MLLLIDDANIEVIKKVSEFFPCDGVTTNPSILKAQGKDPMLVLTEIRDYLPSDMQLHVQVVSTEANAMVEEAVHLTKKLGNDVYVKVPVTREGIKAIKILAALHINVTATAIYTGLQAFMAAKAGAKYVAPYVNRIDNLGADGVKVAKDIHDMLKTHELNTQVLAASFKNSQQIYKLCQYGIGSVTVGGDVLEGLIKHDATTSAVNQFTQDFYSLMGGKNTMLYECETE